MDKQLGNNGHHQPQLLPWAVVTSTGQEGHDDRIMWAQSGLYRLQVALGDMLLQLRQSALRLKAGTPDQIAGNHAATDVR